MLNLRLLTKLYLTPSPSKHEQEVSKIIQSELKKMGVDFNVDKYGQVYQFIPGTPLVSAHMDQVAHAKGCTQLTIDEGLISGNGNLGADDKNGVWIALNLIKRHPNISFVFSVEEESGGYQFSQLLAENADDLDKILYGLVFDRRGSGDIIGTYNGYCVAEFEDDLVDLGWNFGYAPEVGTYSDCDTLNLYMSVVNLSCGYYSAHTTAEFTVIWELKNALEFGSVILNKLDKRYEVPEAWYVGNFSYTAWPNSYEFENPSMYKEGAIENYGVVYADEAFPDLECSCPECGAPGNFIEVYSDLCFCDMCGMEYYDDELLSYPLEITEESDPDKDIIDVEIKEVEIKDTSAPVGNAADNYEAWAEYGRKSPYIGDYKIGEGLR